MDVGYFQFPNIRMTTKPVQNPFPLWVGGFGRKLPLRAGREGYHLQGGLPWKGAVQTPRHEPKPPNGLPAYGRVLCNDFGCLSEGRAAPICASVRLMVDHMA
jgi:hypothetical protein